MKKTKIGSSNPKYKKTSKDSTPVIKVHMCDVKTRNSSGEITSDSATIPVYGIFGDGEVVKKKVKEEKWWKNN